MNDIKILIAVLAGNILLMVIKIVGGILGGSAALVADGLHSGADVISTTMALFAVRLSSAPPDDEHPYGHGKIEPLAASISAIILAFVALEIIYSSITGIISLNFDTPGSLTVWIALISIIVNEFMFRLGSNYGKKHGSAAIIANAWDNRSDALTSIGALIGIIFSRFGVPVMDMVSALFIAVMIFRIAYKLIVESSLEIMDTSIPEMEAAVVKYSEKTTGIAHAYARARRIGRCIHVDLKLEMDPEMTIAESHALGKRVERKIVRHFVNIEQVMIHVHPHED